MQSKLTKQVVHGAQPETKEYYIWDTEVKGFGLRVFPAGKKSFVYQYRVRRHSRRVTLGDAGAIHVQQAREDARAAAVTVQRGGDPLGASIEVSEGVRYLLAVESGSRAWGSPM